VKFRKTFVEREDPAEVSKISTAVLANVLFQGEPGGVAATPRFVREIADFLIGVFPQYADSLVQKGNGPAVLGEDGVVFV
jgi:hypothetical protein